MFLPYFSSQEWFSGPEEMLEDHSSCMLQLFPTASDIQNFSFVYWYHVSPSVCVTLFLPLGLKRNRTSLSSSSFEDWAKNIPGDLLQLHQKIMALSAIQIEFSKFQTSVFNTKSASLTCCSYFLAQWPKLKKLERVSNHTLKLWFTHGQAGQNQHRKRVCLQTINRIF